MVLAACLRLSRRFGRALGRRGLHGLGSRDKLLRTVAGMCAVTAAVGYLGLYTAQNVMTSLAYFEEVLVPGNVAVQSARDGLRNARQVAGVASEPLTATGDLSQLHLQFNRYLGDTRRAIDEYEGLRLSDPQRGILAEYRAAQQAYLAATDPLWTATPQLADRQALQAGYQTLAEPQAARMDRVFSTLVVLQGKQSAEQARAAQATYDRAWRLLLGVIGGGILGTLALGIFVARSIASPLEEAALVHGARHDPLTGLPNRAFFADRVEHALARADRPASSVAVLFVDLDGFKAVNDRLGHEQGDALLVVVAQRLKAALRTTDTPARLGGDEFTVLLDGISSSAEAVVIAERIASAVRAPVLLQGSEVVVSASIGIALGAARASSKDLLRRADLAMYRVKENGKGRCAIFDASQLAA